MTLLLTIIILLLCFCIFLQTYWIWSLNQARRRGIYPSKGKATMFDVRRLIMEGEKYLAIRLYGELFKASFKQSKKAVEQLEKSIQEKYFELE